MTFAKVVSLCCCVAAFGVVVAACGLLLPPFPPLFLSFRPLERHPPLAFSTMPLPICLCAGRQAQGQADWQAGWQGCQTGSRQACRPFRLQRKRTFSKVVSLYRYVAAFGVVVAACGVLWPPFPPFSLVLPIGAASALCLPTMPLPVCLCAGRQAQGQTGGQECLLVRGHIGYKQVELFFTCGQCRLVDFLMHSNHCFPIVFCLANFALWHFTVPMPICSCACRHKGRQTGRLVNRQAGKSACHPARKNACRFANLKAYRQAAMLFSLAWQHLALSWQLVAFLSRISDLGNTLPLHPSGRAKPKAHTVGPGSVLLLGS